MGSYELENGVTHLRIKSQYRNFVREVEESYYNANEAFYLYFGEGFQPGFIQTVETHSLPLKRRFISNLFVGEWVPDTRTLRLYPSTLMSNGVYTARVRESILYHEFGHAFDDQSISENIQKTNRAGREAFAELGKIVALKRGRTTEITKELSCSARSARAFLPTSRIGINPSSSEKLEDAAFFHYLISDWGLASFKEFYSLIPQDLNIREYLIALLFSGFSSRRVDEVLHSRLDLSVQKGFSLGGYTMEELTKEAKKWYAAQH